MWEARDVPSIGGIVFVCSLANFVNVILANGCNLTRWLLAVVVKAAHYFLLVGVFRPNYGILLSLEGTGNSCSRVCHWGLPNVVGIKSDGCLEHHAVCLRVQVHVVVDEVRTHQVLLLVLHLWLNQH